MAAAGGKRGGAAKLRKELERFHKDPPDHIQVAVNERDMFEWHYLLQGPDDTPYAGNLRCLLPWVCARGFRDRTDCPSACACKRAFPHHWHAIECERQPRPAAATSKRGSRRGRLLGRFPSLPRLGLGCGGAGTRAAHAD